MIDLAAAAVLTRDLMEEQFKYDRDRKNMARRRDAREAPQRREIAGAADPSGSAALLPGAWSAPTSAG
jgi:hypothetical protein